MYAIVFNYTSKSYRSVEINSIEGLNLHQRLRNGLFTKKSYLVHERTTEKNENGNFVIMVYQARIIIVKGMKCALPFFNKTYLLIIFIIFAQNFRR